MRLLLPLVLARPFARLQRRQLPLERLRLQWVAVSLWAGAPGLLLQVAHLLVPGGVLRWALAEELRLAVVVAGFVSVMGAWLRLVRLRAVGILRLRCI